MRKNIEQAVETKLSGGRAERRKNGSNEYGMEDSEWRGREAEVEEIEVRKNEAEINRAERKRSGAETERMPNGADMRRNGHEPERRNLSYIQKSV